MKSTRVGASGQITIPVWIRKKLGIKPGTKVLFEEKGDEIIAHPITPIHNKICKSTAFLKW